MSANKGKLRSALGNNPLSQGIFSKTEASEIPDTAALESQDSSLLNLDSSDLTSDLVLPALRSPEPLVESSLLNQESINLIQQSSINDQEDSFLAQQPTERVNLRLSVEINDWLDDLLKQGKRKHGRKIPKEVWVQAALEFFRALPADWQAVDSEEHLREILLNLQSRINNQESIK